MIARVIRWSVAHRGLVIALALAAVVAGVDAIRRTPLDAIPDLSDAQVIVKTSFPGQAPQVVEDQVTYPLASALLAVPGAVHVRGLSGVGESYVYVLFEDGTDTDRARARVLEHVSQVREQLPSAARPQLGPDASGVGWVYQYVLVDRTGGHDLAELRSLQDWFLKFELQTVPGVAEVASVGGVVKQYQVVLDPGRMRAHGLSLPMIHEMIVGANREVSGSVVEMGEAEYLVRARGYLRGVEDLKRLPYLMHREVGAALLLQDIADVGIGPQMRSGIADLDGEGEVAGGIVVMRSGANAQAVAAAVKAKLAALAPGLPPGVEIVETYDRSALIGRAVSTLEQRLVEEIVLVVVVCAAFLLHLRSALVVLVTLPLGVLVAFVVMRAQGLTANVMSLGGIAIALGATVDAAIVMIENVHKRLERRPASGAERLAVVQQAMAEVGPPLFFSLLIIALSFLPVLGLEGPERRMFAPLAYTKTWAMAAAAALSVTLVPVLVVLFVTGRLGDERENPLSRVLVHWYRRAIGPVLAHPRTTLVVVALLAATALWPLARLGTEFMPRLDEGDLLYMPTTLPGLSAGKAQQLLQQTDRLIKSVPEVARVFGKAGHAETATDPAPLTMLETTIRLRPRSEWRPGLTLPALVEELDRRVQVPGLVNSWQMPIAARVDMLSTGIKTPVGVRIAGPDLATIDRLGAEVASLLRPLPGTASVFADRTGGGRYVEITVDRDAAAHYGLNVADVYEVIETAVGGMNVAYTVEGRERYPINVRYPREVRDSLTALRELPLFLMTGQQLRLSDVADVAIASGPDMIRSEDARPVGWVYADVAGRDLGAWVEDARRVVAGHVALPAGYSIAWAGQYEQLARARARLAVIVPITLLLIGVLLYATFGSLPEVLFVMGALPLALVGGVWLLFWLGYELSVAVAVGLIALAGVAAEFGVVMLVYLDQSVKRRRPTTLAELHEAVIDGAVLRVRPKAMTIAVVIAGLVPIMVGEGAGSEVMRRIAAPMVGGMVTAPLVSMLVIPVLYVLWKSRDLAGPVARVPERSSPLLEVAR